MMKTPTAAGRAQKGRQAGHPAYNSECPNQLRNQTQKERSFQFKRPGKPAIVISDEKVEKSDPQNAYPAHGIEPCQSLSGGYD
jgi:hypothetical protein